MKAKKAGALRNQRGRIANSPFTQSSDKPQKQSSRKFLRPSKGINVKAVISTVTETLDAISETERQFLVNSIIGKIGGQFLHPVSAAKHWQKRVWKEPKKSVEIVKSKEENPKPEIGDSRDENFAEKYGAAMNYLIKLEEDQAEQVAGRFKRIRERMASVREQTTGK